jgi:hypothetical protein
MPELKCKCGKIIAEIDNAGQRYTYKDYIKCPTCNMEMCVICLLTEHKCGKEKP